MSKKRTFRGFFAVIILLLILAAGAVLLFMPKKPAKFPEFSAMPTDTAGYNMIGNMPENLASGGFMAGQNGWIYFANFTDGGSLYMCREDGADMIKLTDFPVCNINVLGSSVVFTGLELSPMYAESLNNENSPLSGRDSYLSVILSHYINNGVLPGGKLYAIYGINSASKPRLCAINPDTDYFSPHLGRDGLYAAGAHGTQGVIANLSDGTGMIVAREDEYIEKTFSYGSTIYAALYNTSDKKSRIMRIDAQTLFPLDYINGDSLYRFGNGFIFRGEDGFVYEMSPADEAVRPISLEPVEAFKMNQFGEIIADSGKLIISKEKWYGDIAETLLTRRESKPITMQNGWYSYYNADSRYGGEVYFNANGKYYGLDNSGWSAGWLNVRLDTEPMVSLGDLIVEDLFTPPWLDFSGNMEPIDPAGSGDFGSERPAHPGADNREDASKDARNALDAAILLLLEDEVIADKYTGESVEKLRARYGNAFETALTDTAGRLAGDLETRFGIAISQQEAWEILTVWLRNTSYEIGGSQDTSNGEESSVTITVKNPVVMSLIDSVDEAEGASYADILREAGRDGNMSDMQVYMRKESDGCWIAENPERIIRVFVQGLD